MVLVSKMGDTPYTPCIESDFYSREKRPVTYKKQTTSFQTNVSLQDLL